MHKLMLVIGAGIGYVLGAKAGRERYEQLADQASKAWADPRVQSKIEEVKGQAPVVAAKVGESAKAAAETAKAKAGESAKTAAETAKTKVKGQGSVDTRPGYPTGGAVNAEGQLGVSETGFGPGGDKLP